MWVSAGITCCGICVFGYLSLWCFIYAADSTKTPPVAKPPWLVFGAIFALSTVGTVLIGAIMSPLGALIGIAVAAFFTIVAVT